MEIQLEEIDDGVHVLRADGGINGDNAEQLIDDVVKVIDRGARKIIVDCSDLKVISSAGLATLLMLHSRGRTHGAEVKVAAVNGIVAQVLQITRLNVVLSIHPDVNRAKLAFRED
ncbi:MAG: anti-sigma factor antagonist [Planctomycetia bacterium]|jgi:anti-sigma B factor antagonist|nr:anti-sigma factor antagonist [Planctomycetia bacterium]